MYYWLSCFILVPSQRYHIENCNEDAGCYVLLDTSVCTEGSYHLKLSLFEVIGWSSLFCTCPCVIFSCSNTICHCRSICLAAFYIYTAKSFQAWKVSPLLMTFVLSDLSSLCPHCPFIFVSFWTITLFHLWRQTFLPHNLLTMFFLNQ